MKNIVSAKFAVAVFVLLAAVFGTGCAGGKLTDKYLGGGIPRDILKAGPKWPAHVLAERQAQVDFARQNGGKVFNGYSHGYAVPYSQAVPETPVSRRDTYVSNGRTFRQTSEGSQVWVNTWQDWNTPGVLITQPQVWQWKWEAQGTLLPQFFNGTEIAPGQGATIGNTGTRTWSVVPAPRPQKAPRVIRLN